MAPRSPLTLQPYDYIGDSTGRPLDKGQIYIGVAGQDPEFYQIPVFLDEAMTLAIDQPIRTNDGFVDFAGDLRELYASEEVYSLKVLDKQGRKVIYKAEMMRDNLTSDALQLFDAIRIAGEDAVEATADANAASASAQTAAQSANLAAVYANDKGNIAEVAGTRANQAADDIQVILDNGLTADNIITSDGSTQEFKNTELQGQLDALPFDDGVLVDTAVATVPQLVGQVARTQAKKNIEQVSVKDFGALGDSTGAVIQQWYTAGSVNYRGYVNLAAVQADYPHVTSKDDTIDWVGCQAALNSESNKIYAPSGSYVFNKPLKTKHTGSYYRNDTGQVFYGDGVKTNFTRSDMRPATRVLSTATDLEKANADIANANECCIAVHSSHMDIFGIRISDSPVGVYMGQDHDIVESGGASHNSFDRVTLRNCGTGIIMAASQGNHYNDFSRIHFVQCQIDMHLKNSARWTGSNNNNRNTFFKIRSARSRIGIWIQSGDSNVLYSWHGEGCGTTAANNTFAVPVGMPDDIQSGVHVIGGQLNRVHNSQMENCEIELYNSGFNNEFYANGYHEGVEYGTQVINKARPANFISQNTFYTGGLAYTANLNTLAFPDIPVAGVFYVLGKGITIAGSSLKQVDRDKPSTKKESSVIALEGILKGETSTLELWKYQTLTRDTVADIKVTVVGISTESNVPTRVSANVLAMRSSSGTLIRYGIADQVGLEATGANTTTTSTPITLSLTITGKDLILNIKAPSSRDIASATVYIESLETKAV